MLIVAYLRDVVVPKFDDDALQEVPLRSELHAVRRRQHDVRRYQAVKAVGVIEPFCYNFARFQ